jgi:histo-blood group ABO system transferase
MSSRRPRVSVVAIATGRYREFVPALIAGAQAHVLGLERIFVMSDAPPHWDELLTWLPLGHMPWPYPTLLRYRAMTAYADILEQSDVLLYVDVDMRIQRSVDLPSMQGTLAVQHPGCIAVPPIKLPYERRVNSTSHVALGEGTDYFAGGVQGGHGGAYLKACATMANWIQADLANGVIPLWHDESAWNRYCILYPPEVILPHSYCSPEYDGQAEAIIVALDKDHDRLRETPLSARIEREWQRKKSGLVRRARRAAYGPRSSA